MARHNSPAAPKPSGRPPHPQQRIAVDVICHTLRAGLHPDMKRAEFSATPKRTWQRWVALAREALAGESLPATAPLVQKIVAPPPRNPAPQVTAPKPGRRHKSPATPDSSPPLTGELIPKPPPREPDEDDDTYLLMTEFGPKEVGITRRWLDAADRWADIGAIERLHESFLDAQALLDHSRRKVGSRGHVILDPSAYANGIDLSRKAIVEMVKLSEKVRGHAEVERFCNTVMQTLRRADPVIAAECAKAMREAIQLLSSQAWPTTLSAPA